MKLTVSGQTKEYKEGLTVAELVVLENVETPEYAMMTFIVLEILKILY